MSKQMYEKRKLVWTGLIFFDIFAYHFFMTKEQKYKAVVHFIEEQIVSGKYSIGDRIPSVNAFRIKFGISRSSVFLALKELQSRGLIEPVQAIGNFVSSNQVKIKEKVLLLFNEINLFKDMIYKSFLAEIDDRASVDIMFHNYNRTVFETLLENADGKYTSYVIMPGKFTGIDRLLSSISGHIVLADHFSASLTERYSSVGQDFESDTYNALENEIEHIRKYRRIILIQQSSKEPEERYVGICKFCSKNGFVPCLIPTVSGWTLNKGDLYITAENIELVHLIKSLKNTGFTLGRDIGIISYNDDPIKEILEGGIATLSSDFDAMGRSLARLVVDKEKQNIRNPYHLAVRRSL